MNLWNTKIKYKTNFGDRNYNEVIMKAISALYLSIVVTRLSVIIIYIV